MALEIARYLPRGASVLDVGCGNGFIAHHLGALLATRVMGIDVGENTTAEIDYMRFDGQSIPAQRQTFDAVLLCYVLHHAQDTNALLSEVSRVLRPGGHTIIYEDIPASIWDRFVCWTHDRKWRTRTGPCTFRHLDDWREIFGKVELEIVLERQLSRWRNLAHPVSRRLYVLRASELESNEIRQVIDATKAILDAVYVAA